MNGCYPCVFNIVSKFFIVDASAISVSYTLLILVYHEGSYLYSPVGVKSEKSMLKYVITICVGPKYRVVMQL